MTNELAIRIITGNVLGTSEQTQEAITMAVKALSMPSARPEVGLKEGYWIYLDNDELRYDSYRCSNCNRSITVDAERKDDIGFIIEDMKYCPNCGAKMIEVRS